MHASRSPQQSRLQRQRGSGSGAVPRPDRARRHQQPAGHARGQQPGGTTFWLDPKNGVQYPIVMQTPQYRVATLSDLQNLPVTATTTAVPQVLGGVAISAATPRTRSSHSTTSSRWFRSTRPRRVATWAPLRRTSTGSSRTRRTTCQGKHGRPARPGADDEQRVRRTSVRPARRHRADLSADRGQFSILERSIRHRLCAAGGARGHRVAVVCHGYHAVGAGAHGRNLCMGVATANSVLVISLRASASQSSATRSPLRSRRAWCVFVRY